jgi:hypothetical protein
MFIKELIEADKRAQLSRVVDFKKATDPANTPITKVNKLLQRIGIEDYGVIINKPFDSKTYELLIDTYMNKVFTGSMENKILDYVIKIYQKRGVKAKELPPTTEGTRCWKGYKKKGTKKMFGKTVPNCVKNEQVAPLSKSNSPYKQAVDMWLRSKDGRDKKAEDFKELSVVQQNKYLDKFKIKETIEASQDLNALMQGIEHDLANREKEIEENLRAWFGKGKKGGAGGGGWDRYNTKGERIGKCGDAKKGEGKPKCLSKSKAASLRSSGGKKAIGKAVSKKRRNDPNKNRKGKAKNVSNTVGKKK